MTDWRRIWRLTRTLLEAEVGARGRSLAFYPVGFGMLFVAVTAIAVISPSMLTGTTQTGLKMALGQYFTSVSGPRFAVALVVVQAPVLISIFSVVVATPTARSLAGRRVSSGEFETLLAAPYSHAEIFLALVVTAFMLAVSQTVVLAFVGVGGAWAVIIAAGARFALSIGPIIYAPYLVPFSVALWGAFVATVVYLVYPETALSGAGTGNLLLLIAYLPAFGLLGLTTTSTPVSPLFVAVTGFVGVSMLTGIGVVAIQNWFRPTRLL